MKTMNCAVLLLAASFISCANAGFYDDNDDIVMLNSAEEFEKTVEESDHLWVVEYYADWCGHCQQFAPQYEKAASNMKGMVKFAAVNNDAAPDLMLNHQVQSFPTIKIFPAQKSKNPYTGVVSKSPIDYPGQRTAKALVEVLTQVMPSYASRLGKNGDDFQTFIGEEGIAKAVLFTTKSEPPSLLKALSADFRGLLRTAFVVQLSDNDVIAEKYDVEKYPSLVLVKADGSHELYDGKLKLAEIQEFLAPHALPQSEKRVEDDEESQSKAKDKSARVVTVDDASYRKVVEGSKSMWVVAFQESDKKGELAELAKTLHGISNVALAPPSACSATMEKIGVKEGEFRAYGYGKEAKKKSDGTQNFDDLNDARRHLYNIQPNEVKEDLDMYSLQTFIAAGVQRVPSKSAAVLFTENDDATPFYKGVALEFSEKILFGQVTDPDEEMKKQFQVKDLPQLMILHPDPRSPGNAEAGQTPMAGELYNKKAMGEINFANVATFVSGFLRKWAPDTLQDLESEEGISEIDDTNFDDLCVNKGGICLIAFLDGSKEKEEQLADQLDILEQVKARKAGMPVSFSWVDGTCRYEVAEQLGVELDFLPSAVVLSPSRLRSANLIGKFDVTDLSLFVERVMSGKVSTNPMSELPVFGNEDCDTKQRWGVVELSEEEDALQREIMEEILAEQRERARIEEEERLKEEAAEKERKRLKKEAKKAKKEAKKAKKAAAGKDEL